MRLPACFFFVIMTAGMMTRPVMVCAAPESLPVVADDFIIEYCVDCHDSATSKGDLNLEIDGIDWASGDERAHWEYLHMMVDRNKMPPKNKSQPSKQEKAAFLAWLDGKLMKHSPIGGTPLRRLNSREYIESIRRIFGFKSYSPPPGFPEDSSVTHFDSVSETLVISPTHMEAYAEAATVIADQFFPPAQAAIKSKTFRITPDDMVISYSSAMKHEGAMRLAAKGSKTRTATWPSKFEAPVSGTYRVTVNVSSKKPPAGHTPELLIKATPLASKGKDRQLKSLKIQRNKQETFQVDLFKGETLMFQYANAPYSFENQKAYEVFLKKTFTKEPKLAAAWQAVDAKKQLARGGLGWQRVKTKLKDKKLKKLSPPQIQKLAAKLARNKVNSGETLIYKYLEQGPNIGIHEVKILGPVKVIVDKAQTENKKRRDAFLGQYASKKDDASIEAFLAGYLSKAFRRPARSAEVKLYRELVKQEMASGFTLDDGLHLAIRTSLMSPAFLYREGGETERRKPAELTNTELAARLSYFLTSAPPSEGLFAIANEGRLSKGDTLKYQAAKLLKQPFSRKKFIHDFTSQWLDTDSLDVLMPDPSVFKDFNSKHIATLKQEVESTFNEILSKNRPVIDFIDPDFIYTDSIIGGDVYQLPQFKNMKVKNAKSREGKGKGKGNGSPVQRISISRGTRRGGLLSMPAVMAATANGVDTQPVVRGVWVMENILGTPPPHPPKQVPALTPDTTGTKGPREQLAAHMDDPNCISCHEEIDPLGFVLENHDPIGRWRTHYPPSAAAKAKNKAKGKGKGKGKSKGQNQPRGMFIDASGVLPTGDKLKDVTDLKRWLVNNPEYFTSCLARKLLTYATGRELNYRERKAVDEIVRKNLASKQGFNDLMLDLIDSDIFRAK